VFVEEFAQKDCGVTLDTTCLAEVFELTPSSVLTIHKKTQKKQRPPHRPLALSNEQKLQFCEMIREKAGVAQRCRRKFSYKPDLWLV
jgi:hypothetical protein